MSSSKPAGQTTLPAHGLPQCALRQPFGDRRLADTGLTKQRRIVFVATVQDLDHASQFFFTSNNPVNPAGECFLRQIRTILVKKFTFPTAIRISVSPSLFPVLPTLNLR